VIIYTFIHHCFFFFNNLNLYYKKYLLGWSSILLYCY
jgi:hypothetical protein